jgi:hypothetical protein
MKRAGRNWNHELKIAGVFNMTGGPAAVKRQARQGLAARRGDSRLLEMTTVTG